MDAPAISNGFAFGSLPGRSNHNLPICRFHLAGTCRRGAACKFRHDAPTSLEQMDPIKQPYPCVFYQQGKCLKGESCLFQHIDLSRSSNTATEVSPFLSLLLSLFDVDVAVPWYSGLGESRRREIATL